MNTMMLVCMAVVVAIVVGMFVMRKRGARP